MLTPTHPISPVRTKMAQSSAARPTQLHTSQAQEFPVLRLTLADQQGSIQRMTLLSTRPISSSLDSPEGLAHIEALAALADLHLLEIHQLSHLHLEMRSHPPSEPPGAEHYGLV